MYIKNKKGFTLIEVVVSIVLIGILSLGFLQVYAGFSGITAKKIAHDQATDEFSEIIDRDEISKIHDINNVTLKIGDSATDKISLKQYTINKSDEDKGVLRYYKFSN